MESRRILSFMTAHTIERTSQAGAVVSSVELADIRHVFATTVPCGGRTFRQQADDALQHLDAVARAEAARRSIVRQAVFLSDAAQLEECRRMMHRFYGADLPVTSYIFQPPCDGKLLAIEALGVGPDRGEVRIERVSERLVIARHNDIAWIHCAQAVPRPTGPKVYDAALQAFDEIRGLLAGVGVRFEQVIRTWLYLGGIVAKEGPLQRYQELNRARTDYYRDIAFLADRLPPGRRSRAFPASTGIGTEGRDILVSAIALATERRDIVAVPLENPRQTAAFDYPEYYSPTSPKFCRAMALSCGSYATILVSGTASITNAETRHVGDPAAQCQETLENIAALVSEENLARHGLPGLGSSLSGLGLVRVYIKRAQDYEKIRAMCEKHLEDVPTIYAIADVCRGDLLVEIEGIAFSRRTAASGAEIPRPHFRLPVHGLTDSNVRPTAQ